MSNISVGRHSAGSPIARTGIKPPKKRGQAEPASNKFATASRPETSSVNTNYKSSPEKIIRQAPSPFRNPQPSSKPTVPSGTRAASKPMAGQSSNGAQRNTSAVGVSGGAMSGMGSEQGKVAGRSQPKRAGDPWKGQTSKANSYSGRGGAPSFYGR